MVVKPVLWYCLEMPVFPYSLQIILCKSQIDTHAFLIIREYGNIVEKNMTSLDCKRKRRAGFLVFNILILLLLQQIATQMFALVPALLVTVATDKEIQRVFALGLGV